MIGVLAGPPSILDTRSPEAHELANLWWLMFAMAAAVYLIVGGFIVFALLRGRRTEDGKPSRVTDSAFITVGGLAVPVLILAVLAVATVRTTVHLGASRSGATRVEVVGKRWWWEVRYPGTKVVTANEIRAPVGRPVRVGLASDDVIHSFWVPQLMGKVDTIPGQRNVVTFTATRAGVYRGECAEFCGIQHANMNFLVIAQPARDFDRWITQHSQAPGPPDSERAAAGQVVFLREACAGCHTVRGTSATGRDGPDLSDFGGRRTIGALTVPNTRDHLAAWMADAPSVKPGVLMPPIRLSGQEIESMVAYLESLK